MVQKKTFTSAHAAALRGLHPAIRGDQALVHGLMGFRGCGFFTPAIDDQPVDVLAHLKRIGPAVIQRALAGGVEVSGLKVTGFVGVARGPSEKADKRKISVAERHGGFCEAKGFLKFGQHLDDLFVIHPLTESHHAFFAVVDGREVRFSNRDAGRAPNLFVVVRPEHLASNDAFCDRLDEKAMLNRDRTSALYQLIDHRGRHIEDSCEFSLRAKVVTSNFDWGFRCVHSINVAPLQRFIKPCYIFI